jgi:hypothetical protein
VAAVPRGLGITTLRIIILIIVLKHSFELVERMHYPLISFAIYCTQAVILVFRAEKPSIGITLCFRYNQTPISSVQASGKMEQN